METEVNTWLIGGGLFLGLAFGVIVQRSRFCMVAAVSNLWLMRDFRQLHAYLAALAVAILGTALLEFNGWVAVSEAAQRSAHIDWTGALLGGLVFGFGSMLAGGCAGRTVVRVAEGNLGAFVALLAFGLAAAATFYGVLEPARIWLMRATAFDLVRGDASLVTGVGLSAWVVGVPLVIACMLLMLLTGRGQKRWGLIAAGAAVGMLIVAGWWVTGYLSHDEFSTHRPASLTFAGPLARATIYVATGAQPGTGFGVALVGGTLLGACLSALFTRSFRWNLPQPTDLGQLLLGGSLMGIGAICAGGCNVGQGLSGVSTASATSMLALISIVVGMLLGLAWLNHRERARSRKPGILVAKANRVVADPMS
jgi:uncharacterized membrane protein YedE/YeeE